MTVHIDWSRAETICGQLLTAYRAKAYPYDQDWALPQTFIPEEIRKDQRVHANFLFGCCHFMRGTIKSDHAVKQLVKIWQQHPEFFDPRYVRMMSDLAPIEDVLAVYIGYKSKEMARFWQINFGRLADRWQGDARKIFTRGMTSQLLYERVVYKKGKLPLQFCGDHQGFPGFQKKMASMLAYFLMEAGLVKSFTASPPVDFHLIRVLTATGVFQLAGRANGANYRFEHLSPLGVEVLEQYARTHRATLVDIGNALWMLSVVLCSFAPGNRSTAVKRKEDGSKEYPKPIPVQWDNAVDLMRYFKTCGRCPVAKFCTKSVFSGPYYQEGEFIVAERQRPPVTEIGFLGPQPHAVNPRLPTRGEERLLKAKKAVVTTETSQLLFDGDLGTAPEE